MKSPAGCRTRASTPLSSSYQLCTQCVHDPPLSPLCDLLTGPCWGPAEVQHRCARLPPGQLHVARLSSLVPQTVYVSYTCSCNSVT